MPSKKKSTKNETALKQNARRASQEIAAMVCEQRIKKNLSQVELAHLLGYDSAQYISDWERAYNPIPLPKLVSVAKLLDLNRDKLFALFLEFATNRFTNGMKQEYQDLIKKKVN